MGKLLSDCIDEQDEGSVVCSLMDQPDVILDFSSPLAIVSLLPFAIEHKIPLVIGTTGFSGMQQLQITRAAEQIPILQSANMSIGATLCIRVVEKITQHLVRCGVKFDVGITEIHHNQKQDQPSGTALWLGESAKGGGYTGQVQYASLRLGDIAGEHQVIFSLPGEQLVIRHHADTRKNFALGALKAANWIVAQTMPGLYDMQQVLDFDKV